MSNPSTMKNIPAPIIDAYDNYAAETSPPARRVKLEALAKACNAAGYPLQEAVDRIHHSRRLTASTTPT